MEKIIKKAIEGEWIKSPYKFELKEIIRNETAVIRFYMEGGNYKKGFPSDTFYSFYQIVCDPLFWQALGKACGWKRRGIDERVDNHIQIGMIVAHEDNTQDGWKYHALQFHEINLTQGFNESVAWLEELVIKDK